MNYSIVESESNNRLYHDPHFLDNRRVMVHLMEWRYEDIAMEAECFLGPNDGFGGVQLSPVNEHAILDGRPWYERYQPVSYKLETRSGNELEFRSMVRRCNLARIRVYVDVILNHMTGGQIGQGTAGSQYNGHQQLYPGVPFNSEHFNGSEQCPTNDLEIKDFDDPIQARNCRLWGLRDLNQSLEYVRQKQVDFLNKLIDAGVAGFRCDASTHMWPKDLKEIFSRLNNLNTEYFPPNSKPFIYHETIYYGGAGINSIEYTRLGRIIEFRFWKELTNVFRGNNQLKWLRNFGPEWNLVNSEDALVMIDSHDLRVGHNGDLTFNINCFQPKLLKASTAFMLAWNYGIPRILSSYRWLQKIDPKNGKDLNEWMGPPTDPETGQILSAYKKIINKSSSSSNNSTINSFELNEDAWIGEHRWPSISNMIQFKTIVGDEPIKNWWDNGSNQIAFSRGNKGFIAFNLESKNNKNSDLNQILQTGLPSGIYYDIISSEDQKEGNNCNGKLLKIDQNGFALIQIFSTDPNPFIAIHLKSKLN